MTFLTSHVPVVSLPRRKVRSHPAPIRPNSLPVANQIDHHAFFNLLSNPALDFPCKFLSPFQFPFPPCWLHAACLCPSVAPPVTPGVEIRCLAYTLPAPPCVHESAGKIRKNPTESQASSVVEGPRSNHGEWFLCELNAFRTASRPGIAATTAGGRRTELGATVTVLRAASGRGHEATRQRPAHSARGAEPLGSDRTNPPSPAEPIRSTPTRVTCSFPPW